MRSTQSLSITLPHDMAQMVKQKVASGEYATESEVIRDGLRSLQARDAALEKWLRDEVVKSYDEYRADPTRAIDGAELKRRMAAHLRAFHGKSS
ncbi:type II toxin-antitoxin system ParD family antitoxin [Labrys okinawensis]|uniref:Type II toxin-antitoxin system ParD family antitoxin n=1 Tax=Labrys okinawensis TaxID=346911 RepID=A0A2S9QAC5_9HYPH|nr:type II toxin-antitoxin system ParD family antitoxin [Labrys okinawensis]PRH86302.1 type II toxin-antitoxin system ParD family antitoxin [Labrys okinawensis]